MADKNFKVKTGLDTPVPLPVTMGGTGQTSTTNTLNSLLPVQSGQSGKYLTSDGTNTSWGTISTLMPSATVSSNITLSSNYKYFVDTSAARSLTLPASPSVGDEIYIFDSTGQAATNNISISRNSNKINGQLDDAIIDISTINSFIYTGSNLGWRFI